MTTLIVALKKAAFLLLNDKRVRTGIASAIVGIVGIILIMFGTLFTLFTVETEHRKELIDYIFNENISIESIMIDFPNYYTHITESRKYLKPIGEEAERINAEVDGGNSLDVLKIKIIFYVLFLENEFQPDNTEGEAEPDEPTEPPTELENLPDTADFVNCFYKITDGEISIITVKEDYYNNLETRILRAITTEEKERIEEIYNYLTGNMIPSLIYDGEYSPPLAVDIFTCITSPYGTRKDPFTGKKSYHNGTDLAFAGCYGAPIYAVADGTVTRASDVADGFGICVVIDHGGGMLTYYAHCSSVNVNVGDTVTKGQFIAKIGSTGRSTASHLHFGLKVNNTWQEPLSLFRQ